MKKKKVLQVLHTLGQGGAEKLALQLEDLLSPEYEFIFCALDASGEIGEQLKEKGRQVIEHKRTPGFDTSSYKLIGKILREEKVDIIHAHHYTPYSYAALASFWNHFDKLIFTEHGRHQPDHVRFKRLLCKPLFLSRTAAVTAVSEFTKQSLIRYEKIPEKRIQVIYNGIDSNLYGGPVNTDQVKKQMGLPLDLKLIGHVAGLRPVKNQEMLLRAFKLAEKEDEDLGLAIAGEGEVLKDLQILAHELEISEKCYFLGWVKNIPELMRAFDIFVLSSKIEAIAFSLLEAMAAQIPVVATNVGGNPELIVDQKGGLLVPPESPEALSEAIVKLINDSEMKKNFTQFSLNRVQSVFSLDKMAENYLQLYQKVARKKND